MGWFNEWWEGQPTAQRISKDTNYYAGEADNNVNYVDLEGNIVRMPKGSVNVPKGFMEEGTFYYDMGGQRRPILKGTVDKYAVVGPSSSGNSQAVVKVDPTPEVEIDTRDLNQIAIDNAGVPYYDDTAPVSPFGDGYHQREGTNAWTVNNNDDFWMTEEGGKKAETIWGSRPGFVKQKPVQEFQMPDFSSWFQGDK